MSDVADFWAAREVVGVFSDYDEERDRETVRLARKVFAVEDAVSVQGGKVDGFCVCCGVAFVGPVGKKYCSVNCYQHTKFGKMLRERVACGFCGEMFRPTTGIQKFCGNPCRLRALAGNIY